MEENLYTEEFAFAAMDYNDRIIIAAPQLNDWGETSARQTIALTEYLLEAYNIDPDQVYAKGYSGGGETMSHTPVYLVVGEGGPEPSMAPMMPSTPCTRPRS